MCISHSVGVCLPHTLFKYLICDHCCSQTVSKQPPTHLYILEENLRLRNL